VQEALTVVDLELTDYERMAELVETYADFPLGTTDAAVVAVAERLRITEIATFDRRHFHAVRPRHTDGFQLLP
jgi:predicted nucleic acid-binding protein